MHLGINSGLQHRINSTLLLYTFLSTMSSSSASSASSASLTSPTNMDIDVPAVVSGSVTPDPDSVSGNSNPVSFEIEQFDIFQAKTLE